MLKLLYVYRFATLGGVERVLISRAEAFRDHQVPVKIFLYFFKDLGAIDKLNNYFALHELSDNIQIVNRIDENQYDFIISIDTPQILKFNISKSKLLFECHTTYLNSRKYLMELPAEVRVIVVPSSGMKTTLAQERPELKNKIVVVRNYVPEDTTSYHGGRIWVKRPLLYLGRMDEHKNICELLDVFAYYRSHYGDDMMLVLVGMSAETINLPQELQQRNLTDRAVVLPPVGFDKVNRLYSLIKKHGGIFMSSSVAESFGLSAAEAMVNGLPVLLSGTHAHVDLVEGNMNFLYPLGNVPTGAGKLKHIVDNYAALLPEIEKCKGQFSVKRFIEDWQLLKDVHAK
ncbi:glycosyltransferase [Geotalea daltonii FRC-32]|uniref:Glycosyltransferase n=1 Tax=Geotalea daltonii (strain DSM 22248 / JCM 15807 / FRC-32) TaxID=316067 RepID=B9M565_GEODF|nr:glycosyltransferase family 4 protein [Geotalea daltonii]ACM19820.1 glycosyltransferase [Geotalea daltonii FRC-32]